MRLTAAMDHPWWILPLFISLLLSFALKILLLSSTKTKAQKLPPGPRSIPILSPLLFLSRDLLDDVVPILRRLRAKYGPMLTLRITSRPSIFISDSTLAHRALVLNGAVFADRVPATAGPTQIFTSDGHIVSAAPYGPLWRLLRRNLASQIFHPSRIKHFAGPRNWVLNILIDKLKERAESDDGIVVVMESFKFAMFCLLVLMCFGQKLDVDQILHIEDVQKRLLKTFAKSNVLPVFPKITKYVFRERWKSLLDVKRKQEEIFIPLIQARGVLGSYVDSLLELTIPEDGGRKLTEGEIVSLCSEFLTAGTDTTATALEWTMAELTRHPEMQKKLLEEIESVLPTNNEEAISEEDLARMPYLKAVIMEGLRRHPPTHFLLPHTVTEDVEIGGYVIPTHASVNFMVGEMGWDEKTWDGPMEFRPERFLAGGEGEGVDITGSREIKMIPFGAGRRICPALGLAMLHLEYFVANLMREFEWKAVEGEEVDLSEKLEVTVVMKNQLRARIVPRRKIKNKIVSSDGI